MSKNTIRFMCDLETLGVELESVILSIALVPFGFEGASEEFPFYARLNYPYQRGTVNLETIAWWMKQSEAAREESFSGEEFLSDVLRKIFDYVKRIETKYAATSVELWGNGADFDCKMLEVQYKDNDIKFPFHYTQFRCFRTLKALYPMVTEPEFVGIKHSAIDDARHEAKWAERILDYIKLGVNNL